jgi:nitroreductase
MDAMDCLMTRQSTPPALLSEPVPNGGELEEILATAMRAPDHAAVRPWRFLLIEGDARLRLGDVLAEAVVRLNPGADEAEIEKARNKPLRAPMIICVAAEITPDHPKAPEVEQVIAASAAAQNILNALHASGFGAILLTGKPCYDDGVKAALGFAPKDVLIGFIYTGTPEGVSPAKSRPEPKEFLRTWSAPVTV